MNALQQFIAQTDYDGEIVAELARNFLRWDSTDEPCVFANFAEFASSVGEGNINSDVIRHLLKTGNKETAEVLGSKFISNLTGSHLESMFYNAKNKKMKKNIFEIIVEYHKNINGKIASVLSMFAPTEKLANEISNKYKFEIAKEFSLE